MKKLFMLSLFATLAVPAFAQESVAAEEAKPQPTREDRRREDNVWPAFFAVCEFPSNPDVIGLRLSLPFSTMQDNVTGIDLGLWGRCLYFEGLAISILRNDVKDDLSGFQIGLYNSADRADLFAVQVGLWNEASTLRGIQAGLVNVCGEARGLQVGLINRSETMYGYQVGLINVIRDAELQFFPIINIGF